MTDAELLTLVLALIVSLGTLAAMIAHIIAYHGD